MRFINIVLIIILIILSITFLSKNIKNKEEFLNLKDTKKYIKKHTKNINYNYNKKKREIRNKLKNIK